MVERSSYSFARADRRRSKAHIPNLEEGLMGQEFFQHRSFNSVRTIVRPFTSWRLVARRADQVNCQRTRP